jgi:CheY-like chemotaxis protein
VRPIPGSFEPASSAGGRTTRKAPLRKAASRWYWVYLNLHEFPKAVEYLKTANRLSPHRRDVFDALDRLERCPSVMVVDDSATIRHLVAHTLNAAGYIVRMAEDGVKALSMLQEGVPDLIFMDISMPRMDGYQVCKVIKQDETHQESPGGDVVGQGCLLRQGQGSAGGLCRVHHQAV